MFKIKVPATTANIGPGFDTLGIALEMFNEYLVEPCQDRVFIFSNESESLPVEENYVIKAFDFINDKCNLGIEGFKITATHTNIPVSRGLGSSAASIVAGLMVAMALSDGKVTKQDLIDVATEMEGHPDNVVPAIVGSMAASITDNGSVFYASVPFPDEFTFNVMIPPFRLSTTEARAALPKAVSMKDCVFNISHVALLICSLYSKDRRLLEKSLEDKIHQPYRLPLINGGKRIMDEAIRCGAVGSFISGAGPTMITLTDAEDSKFYNTLTEDADFAKSGWRLEKLKICKHGAIMEVI